MARPYGIRNRRIARLVEYAVDRGWRTTLDGRGHVRVVGPDGRFFAVSTTSNDSGFGHNYENTRAEARRAGLDVRGLG